MKKKSGLIIFFVLLTASGCCNIRRTYTPPVARDLVNDVRKRNRSARSIRAVVKADQFTKQGRVKLKVYILAEKEGKLRFEATVMDNTVAVLASDGVRFRSIDFKEHVVYEGPASPCNIARVFNIPLTGDQVAVVLMGGVPILEHDSAEVKWDKCKGREILSLEHRESGVTQQIYLKKREGSWQITGTRIKDGKDKTLLTLTSRGFTLENGLWTARWTHYKHPQKKADVMIRFLSQSLNVDIPEEAFELEFPHGLKKKWLECEDLPGLPFEPVGGP